MGRKLLWDCAHLWFVLYPAGSLPFVSNSVLKSVNGRRKYCTLSLEELAADNFSHREHLLFLEFLRRNAGVKVVQQLTKERKQWGGGWIIKKIITWGTATGWLFCNWAQKIFSFFLYTHFPHFTKNTHITKHFLCTRLEDQEQKASLVYAPHL